MISEKLLFDSFLDDDAQSLVHLVFFTDVQQILLSLPTLNDYSSVLSGSRPNRNTT